jgi:hypothetical protein
MRSTKICDICEPAEKWRRADLRGPFLPGPASKGTAVTDDPSKHEHAHPSEGRREAVRKQRLQENSKAGDLDDALDDTFPASDPPSMTQPRTRGAPHRNRRAK